MLHLRASLTLDVAAPDDDVDDDVSDDVELFLS